MDSGITIRPDAGREGPDPDGTLLPLLWLASPALPVGGFAYSEGLEAAVDHGLVTDEASAAGWLSGQLRLNVERAELPVLARAVAAWRTGDLATLRALNDWVLTSRESAELRLQTVQMGRSLLDWLRGLNPGDCPGPASATRWSALGDEPPTWPLAWALAASGTSADTRCLLLAFGFGWCETMAQAAVRAVPLGQAAGQRLLGRLAGELSASVDRALAIATGGQPQAFAPMLAVLSARHETQYSRLFRS